MEKRKKLLSAILSVSMIASAFTALPLSASAEGEQNSGEEVTATVSPSTTAGVTTTGEPVATATTEVESTDKPATAATPEATGVVYEDQKIKITNAKADKVTIVISKYYDNKTLAGVELKENVTLENGSGEVPYDLQGKAAKIMVWDDIKTMTPLFATTSVEGTVDPAPTVKPTAPTSQPETTPTAEPTATPTVKPTIDPSAIYYKLDFEDSSKTYINTAEGTTKEIEKWASQYYFAGLSVANDSNSEINKYILYNNTMTARKGQRTAYCILPEEAGTMVDNQAVVEFDFKFHAGSGTNQLVLIGDSNTPIGNDIYDPSKKPAGTAPILKFNQASTDGGDFIINDSGDSLANATAKTHDFKNDQWAHVKAVMNFESKAVILTITSLDGSTTFFETAQVPMSEGTTATKLSQLFLGAPSASQGAIGMDNVIVRKVLSDDITDTYYNVTFTVDGKNTITSVKKDESVTKVPDVAKTGYLFDGWSKDGDTENLFTTEQVLAAKVTADTTYTAVYHKDPAYIEPLQSVEFSSFPENGIPTAGADENTAANNVISVKLIGEIGTDLVANPDSRVTDLKVDWEFDGFRHIASKAADGQSAVTSDDPTGNGYCDSYAEVIKDAENPTSVNFALKSQAFNFYGQVKATVTYNGKTITISKPMAIVPTKTAESGVLLPKPGYVTNFDWYSDDMVGYKAVTSADNKSATEVVTGDWAAYGGNTGRGLYLAKDSTTNKKFLKLKSTGTNSSSFAVNKLDNAPTGQVIITQDVKFYNNNSSILFKQDNPVTWSANATAISFNFTGTEFNLNGGEKICDAVPGTWYKIVLSADVTSKLCFAKVYDAEGTLLGESDVTAFVNAGATAPVYLCYRTPDNSQGELDFNNVKMYTPEIDGTKFTTTVADETISIPEAGESDVTTTLTAKALSTEGYDMIGEATWAFDESVTDTSSVAITPDTTDSHKAILTVKADAPAGTLPIKVTIGGVTKTVNVNLTSSQDSVQFTQSTSSISIPLTEGVTDKYTYAAKVVGPTSSTDKTPMDIPGKTVTYAVYDKNNTNPLTTMPTGVTFDAAKGELSVSSAASATTLYIRATSTNRSDETITKAVKVTIHGLAFDFGGDGEDALMEGYTAVTPTTSYSEATGYGIEGGTPTIGGEASLESADSDYLAGDFIFKTKVTPKKVYNVTITYKGKLASEKVNADLTGVERTNDKLTSATYAVPVIDDVLDLSFTQSAQVASIVIEKTTDKTAGVKPHIYTVGDSTIANNGSWAYVMARDYATYSQLPDIATFSNNGRGGKNLSTYYTGGEFIDRVLVNIRPGDYVMIGDMGTNGMGSAFEASFNYYIDACEAMGAKIILNSYSPHGAVGAYASGYNSSTNTFDSYRRDECDVIVRNIYTERTTADGENYDANIVGFVDIGKMADAAFNAYVNDYATNGYESKDAAAQAIIKCFGDHNHYSNGTIAAELMIKGYGDGADAKGIVKSLYEIISADLANANQD